MERLQCQNESIHCSPVIFTSLRCKVVFASLSVHEQHILQYYPVQCEKNIRINTIGIFGKTMEIGDCTIAGTHDSGTLDPHMPWWQDVTFHITILHLFHLCHTYRYVFLKDLTSNLKFSFMTEPFQCYVFYNCIKQCQVLQTVTTSMGMPIPGGVVRLGAIMRGLWGFSVAQL